MFHAQSAVVAGTLSFPPISGTSSCKMREPGNEYNVTDPELWSSAQSGCGWCCFLDDCVRRRVFNHKERREEDVYNIRFESTYRGSNVSPRGCQGLRVTINSQCESEDVDIAPPRIDVHIFATATSSAASFIPARPLRNDVQSPAAYKQIEEWMSSCQGHVRCGNVIDQMLPMRLIQVTPKLRLVRTEGRKGRYVALSYCWGSSNRSILTKENLASYLMQLDFESLSPTVRDSIEITRRIGLKYIWIDALCIIQDSQEDKARNLSNMHSIYRSSLLTLVAARASGAEQGLFNSTKTGNTIGSIDFSRQSDTRFSIPVKRADGAWGMAFIEDCKVNNEYKETDEPINKRAWTLQERILSRRLLIYGSHTLQWQCAVGTHNFGAYIHNPVSSTFTKVLPIRESSAEQVSLFAPPSSRFRQTELTSRYPILQRAEDKWIQANTLYVEALDWMSLIRAYTDRKLTYAGDKLPGMSGIAELWPQPRETVYLSGLLSFSVHLQLMWWAYGLTRPITYRAPSWSWASVDGKVNHFVSVLDELRLTCLYGTTILGGSTVPKYRNVPYGELTHGVLQVETLLCICWYETSGGWHEIAPNPGNFSNFSKVNTKLWTSIDGANEKLIMERYLSGPNCKLDSVGETMKGWIDTEEDRFSRSVWCMPLLHVSGAGLVGLLVVPVETQHRAYRRVGWFLWGQKTDFERGQPQAVDLL